MTYTIHAPACYPNATTRIVPDPSGVDLVHLDFGDRLGCPETGCACIRGKYELDPADILEIHPDTQCTIRWVVDHLRRPADNVDFLHGSLLVGDGTGSTSHPTDKGRAAKEGGEA